MLPSAPSEDVLGKGKQRIQFFRVAMTSMLLRSMMPVLMQRQRITPILSARVKVGTQSIAQMMQASHGRAPIPSTVLATRRHWILPSPTTQMASPALA